MLIQSAFQHFKLKDLPRLAPGWSTTGKRDKRSTTVARLGSDFDGGRAFFVQRLAADWHWMFKESRISTQRRQGIDERREEERKNRSD